MPKDNDLHKDFPSGKDADDLIDRGDELNEEEELDEEEEQDEGKGKKKAPAKKDAKQEEESEDDEDEESEDDEEEDEEDDSKGKAGTVPVHVLKKAQDKRRAAESRVKELEQRLRQQEENKSDRQKEQFDKVSQRIDTLYEQVEEARAEGRSKDAAKLQRELDDLKGKLTSAQAATLATKQALEAQNTVAFNALVAELETLDPRFDESSDEFDEDLVERVAELTEAYEAKGANSPDALRKAVRLILGNDPFREGRRLQREPEKKAEPRKTDVKKNLDTKKKQPPEDREGNREKAGKIDPNKLSDEDFDKLPASKKRELRGDIL